ncbi:MAG: hypothetical protein COX43_00520 [Parcubacteria group bacterium CG23_combo_of_CG06-09_8_20_14_all_35_9]|nr:MAG: hypothetical protein COX43_00520 [Parcubacteria group bacterium CG23_combo_of_CG06-09_8_20_14_all_35_9]
MYSYIYDSFLNNKKFNGVLTKIENRAIDLGISGKINRLTLFKNIEELVKDEIKRGAMTIVIVGNDKTLSRIINTIAELDIVLGIIPIGSQNKISRVLGIPPGETACDVLSARKIEKVDLGKINNYYFLSSVQLFSDDIEISSEGKFQIAPLAHNNFIEISNLRCFPPEKIPVSFQTKITPSNPQDGILEVFIESIPEPFLVDRLVNIFKKFSNSIEYLLFRKAGSKSLFFSPMLARKKVLKRSIFPVKKITLRAKKSISLLVDGYKIFKTPATIEVVPQKLKMIVGKERLF